MCAPAAAIPFIMMATTLATGAMQANAQRQEGAANAAIAENNQRIVSAQAEAENANATREMDQKAWETRALIGRQKAALASNNADLSQGTAMDILGESAMFGEYDQQTIRNNAARSAWGFQAEKTNLGNQATMAKWSGKTQAAATMLGALGKAYGDYSKNKTAGKA